MTVIYVTVAVEEASTGTKHIREIVIRDGGAYGNPLPPRRMRLRAMSETRKALDALAPDR